MKHFQVVCLLLLFLFTMWVKFRVFINNLINRKARHWIGHKKSSYTGIGLPIIIMIRDLIIYIFHFDGMCWIKILQTIYWIFVFSALIFDSEIHIYWDPICLKRFFRSLFWKIYFFSRLEFVPFQLAILHFSRQCQMGYNVEILWFHCECVTEARKGETKKQNGQIKQKHRQPEKKPHQ